MGRPRSQTRALQQRLPGRRPSPGGSRHPGDDGPPESGRLLEQRHDLARTRRLPVQLPGDVQWEALLYDPDR